MNFKETKKPRVRFCWGCGNQLWGNYYKEIKLDDGTKRIVHKSYPYCEKPMGYLDNDAYKSQFRGAEDGVPFAGD